MRRPEPTAAGTQKQPLQKVTPRQLLGHSTPTTALHAQAGLSTLVLAGLESAAVHKHVGAPGGPRDGKNTSGNNFKQRNTKKIPTAG